MNMRICLQMLDQSWFPRLTIKTYKNVKLTQEMDQRWGQVQRNFQSNIKTSAVFFAGGRAGQPNCLLILHLLVTALRMC